MNAAWFGLLTAVGTGGFYASVGMLVYYVQEPSVSLALRTIAAERPWILALLALAVLVAMVLLTRWYRTRKQNSDR